jgi:hypothetical protein
MALRQKGKYWYGDGPTDVWDYFVQWTRDSVEPVKHWRQAVCKCGHTVFEVDYDEEEAYLLRRCTRCGAEVVMFADEFADVPPPADPVTPNPDPLECICGRRQFEVVGVTAPFMEAPDSAKWFYLGLRCVHCGCLGCYADWIPRYNDHARFLSML